MTLSRWDIKLHALLHDPPHKPLALGRGHERRGREMAEALTGARAPDGVWDAIKRADALASGADRESWLKDLRVDPRTELSVIHPLDGRPILVPASVTARPLELVFSPEAVEQAEKLVDLCAEEFRGIVDDKLRYLLFWRFAVDVIRALEGQAEPHERRLRCGALWEIFPADTRMPDHSVVMHDSLVAALAPILAEKKEAALLRFSVGPVQSFIENARKLRDLWAGSSILAETVWHAMEPIVAEWGPDAILFPRLYGEPRFDRWFLAQVGKTRLPRQLNDVVEEVRKGQQRALRIPSLPNVFTAVVPHDAAENLAKTAEQKVREYWHKKAAAAGAKAGGGDAYATRAAKQAEALVEITWAVAPWPLKVSLSDADLSQPWLGWHRREPAATKSLANAGKLRAILGGYAPNGGILYADSFEQAGVLVDAAKRERIRVSRDEGGLKCFVCGEREVLAAGDFWAQRHSGFAARNDKSRLSAEEQLCGPCTWKRHFDVEGLGQRHPSTGEIAASRFKLELIQKYRDHENLHQAIKRFTEAAQDAAKATAIDRADLQVWTPTAVEMAVRECDERFIDKFARIDGQWLLPFPREEAPDRTAEETGEARAARQKLIQAAARLRAEADKAGIEPPRPYLAVVVFDGDEMGKWVSGTHHGFPRLWDVVHDKVKRQVGETLAPIDKGLPRLLSPAFHATLSAAAATFAHHIAPATIEGEGLCGHLVYAGGDDALFFAPVPDAVKLVRRLRLRFSGWPAPFGENGEEPETELRPWFAVRLGERGLPMPAGPDDRVDELGLAFGGKATASAGMCAFHYRWPLGAALRMAREAEQEAKKSDRNALGITIQRRSGSITRVVLPFPSPKDIETSPADRDRRRVWETEHDCLRRFIELIDLFAAEKVSPRLASLFRAEIADLHAERQDDKDDRRWEMARELARRVARRREAEAGDEARQKLEGSLLAIGEALRARDANRAGDAIHQWSEALTAAAFLARPGERT